LDVIEENYKKAFEYKDYVGNIKKQVVKIFEYNNLL
jgi:hypothetical protein